MHLYTQLESEVPVNCQQLTEDITVSWSIDSTNDIIVFQLCGCVLVSVKDHCNARGNSIPGVFHLCNYSSFGLRGLMAFSFLTFSTSILPKYKE